MPRPRKRAYHHGDLRRALLDAALALLGVHGPRGLSLREVAKKVGVTPAAMYHHFASKEALIVAVAEEGFAELLAYMERAGAAAATPAARLRAMGTSYVDFAIAHPAHFSVMFERVTEYDEYPSLHATAERTFAALTGVIAEAQAAGVVRPGVAAELALLAWSTMHGLANLWLSGAFEWPPTEAFTIAQLTEAATEMLVRGIGAG